MINGRRRGGPSLELLLAVALLTASCTGDDAAVESTTSVVTTLAPTTTSSTTTTTSTTRAPSLDELLRSTLANDNFSATVTAEVVSTSSIGSISAEGAGSINGSDSELRLTSDLTGLLGTQIDRKGRVIGEKGLAETSQHSVVVDGVGYRLETDDKWRISEASDSDTTLGHVFAKLRAVPVFDELGPETIDGQMLTLMRPAEAVDYDPRFFDFDPGTVSVFDAETSVLVDGEGEPVQIRVAAQAEIESTEIRCSGSPLEGWSDCGPAPKVLPTDLELVLDLSEIGSTAVVSPPSRHWVTLSSLDFFGADIPTLFDMEVPADWVVVNQEVGLIQFDTPLGVRVTAFLDISFDRKVPIEDSLSTALRQVGIEADAVAEPDYSVFPSRFVTQQQLDTGAYVMLYHEANLGQLLFSVIWSGPLDAFELQQADFEEVLHTIDWSTLDSGFIPGETLADDAVQLDALGALLTTASIVSDCEEPVPLWTDLVSGGLDQWVEDWYFDTCGTIEIFDVTFTESPQGGIDILFTADSRQPGE